MNKEEKTYRFFGWEDCDVYPIHDEYLRINPCQLYDVLLNVWSRDTCAPRLREKWCEDNKTVGQCSITSFLIQDIYGGKVYGILRPDGNYHCYNLVDGHLFDITSEQLLPEIPEYHLRDEQFREVHFRKEEKRQRYEKLKTAVEELIRK